MNSQLEGPDLTSVCVGYDPVPSPSGEQTELEPLASEDGFQFDMKLFFRTAK